jgi:hypothetical protein
MAMTCRNCHTLKTDTQLRQNYVIYKESYDESKMKARNGRCSRRKEKTGMAESGTKGVQEEKRREEKRREEKRREEKRREEKRREEKQ